MQKQGGGLLSYSSLVHAVAGGCVSTKPSCQGWPGKAVNIEYLSSFTPTALLSHDLLLYSFWNHFPRNWCFLVPLLPLFILGVIFQLIVYFSSCKYFKA